MKNTLNEAELEAVIDRLFEADSAERQRLLRYAAKLPERLLVRAFTAGTEFYFARQGAESCGRGLLQYCGFLRDVKRLHYADSKAMKNKSSVENLPTIEEIQRARRAQAVHQRKSKSKSTRLQQHIGEIITMQQEGYSLRNIVAWLDVNKKFKISVEYLRKEILKYAKRKQEM
ncbi:MAG: hypothetical protein ED859_06660 [Desulfuromonadales bacterium]|nr:MAG: hypothetical protein ED859_06660 [Desulfuromonadales bacterium]